MKLPTLTSQLHRLNLSYAQASRLLENRGVSSVKICHNTRLNRIAPAAIALRYHQTDIVVFHGRGAVSLTSGGWRTSTTKARFKALTDIQVYQKDFDWYVSVPDPMMHSYREIPFQDGMTINTETWQTIEEMEESA